MRAELLGFRHQLIAAPPVVFKQDTIIYTVPMDTAPPIPLLSSRRGRHAGGREGQGQGLQAAKHGTPTDAKLLHPAPAQGTGAFLGIGAACQDLLCRGASNCSAVALLTPICDLWLCTPDFGSQHGKQYGSVCSAWHRLPLCKPFR